MVEVVKVRLSFVSKVSQSPKYRPEIDGLRALAVLAVVLYHAGIAGFSGGFVGVDIFFVISGYLITSIIASDIKRGRFSFTEFYERRIRRIFPALFGMVTACLLFACVAYGMTDMLRLGKSLIAMTAFASNIYFRRILGGAGYFDPAADKEVLLHTWSLSVEEQFYMLFPIALIAAYRWGRGRISLLLGTAIVASFALSVWGVAYKPLGTFYLLPTRAWELLIGSLLAIHSFPELKNRLLREALTLAGLGMICGTVALYTKLTTLI